MPAMSTYLQNALFNAVVANVAYTSPTTVYVALFTSDPGNDNSGTEVTAAPYARMPIIFSPLSSGLSSNLDDITFATAITSWGSITHVGIFDAITNGNLLFHGPLSATKTINAGDAFEFLALDLTVEFH